jgi:hypothetical protein
MNNSNGNLFQTSLVRLGSAWINSIQNYGERNVVQDNIFSNVIKDGYIGSNGIEAVGLRLDTGAINNILQRNYIHDLGVEGPAWDGSRHFFGIVNEAGCDFNTFKENITSNVNEACILNGTTDVTLANGVQFINNVSYNCGQVGILLVIVKMPL